MAINYTNLFTLLGKLVKGVNNVKAYYAELDTDRDAIYSVYNAQSKFALVSGLTDEYDGKKQSILSWISAINSRALTTLQDRDMILEQLPLGDSTDITSILREIALDMIDNTESVAKNTVSVSSITKNCVNANAGTIILDTVLDGFNSPANGFSSQRFYADLNSEIALDDSVTMSCVLDSENGGTLDGEIFRWIGKPRRPSPFHWQDTGSGSGPSFAVLNANSLVSNPDFENFSGDSPSSWTIDAGTAGTHIFKETVNVYRGLAALEFLGNASQASIQVSQAVSGLDPLRRYCFAVWIKGTAGTSSGTLTIQFEGTGYTAGASEKISLSAATLAAMTSYTLKSFHVTIPANVPDDLELVIKWTGTPSAHSVYIDGAAFGPVQYCNGINGVIVAGSEKFLLGDELKFTIATDDGGVFQSWFRDCFSFQIPSDASPSISDSLAT